MDELDRQIVQLLVKDGRMSYTDLGKATGLSTSAVHQRVRRLEQRGVIRGYAAVVDPEAVGLPLTAFISVKPFDPSAPDDIAEQCREMMVPLAARKDLALTVEFGGGTAEGAPLRRHRARRGRRPHPPPPGSPSNSAQPSPAARGCPHPWTG